MKQASFIIIFLFFSAMSYATHNRAGEITVELIEDNKYKVTVTTYTSTLTTVDRDSLLVSWGDGTYTVIARTEEVMLPNDYKKNTYIGYHEFPGPGIYEIVMQDPNRNPGVLNIPNSVFTVFSIKTTLNINVATGNINSPVLLNPPFDRAAVNHPFIHNPAAFDPDGDSLSYALTICRGENGEPIPNYELPNASDTLYVDPITGDLIWNAPTQTGKFNIAMQIYEWRDGTVVSSIVRDMQVDVLESDNRPPENRNIRDYCVLAGNTLQFNVAAIDVDNDYILHSYSGGPFILDNPPTYDTVDFQPGYQKSVFTWATDYSNIRKYPYQIVVKAEDQHPELSLVDIDNIFITVTAPSPDSLEARSNYNRIALSWERSEYGDVQGYNIYRKRDSSDFVIDTCLQGVPENSGFEKIGMMNDPDDTIFYDSTAVKGFLYCYRVTAFYPDGAESQPSDEVCGELKAGSPALLNVSVTEVDEELGEVFLSWAFPVDADTVLDDNVSKEYRISRSFRNTSAFEQIAGISSDDLRDTTYTDTNLDTRSFPYYYKIEIYWDSLGTMVPYYSNGETHSIEIGQTLYGNISAGDNRLTHQIQKISPWIDSLYIIERSGDFADVYDPVGTVANTMFIDSGLINNNTYFYQYTSYGYRSVYGQSYATVNRSHIMSGEPRDTVPPCQPVIKALSSECEYFENTLEWEMPYDSCYEDVAYYNIYYSPTTDGNFQQLETRIEPDQLSFIHLIDSAHNSTAGCYQVSAVDSFGNESTPSTKVCIDECSLYELPNIFAPGNDGIMDIYIANNKYGSVTEVEMQIFNRWGQLVYETSDPDIRWNGLNMNTQKMVSTGVYYYVCVVYEPRITGEESRTLTGFIHVYPDGENVE